MTKQARELCLKIQKINGAPITETLAAAFDSIPELAFDGDFFSSNRSLDEVLVSNLEFILMMLEEENDA